MIAKNNIEKDFIEFLKKGNPLIKKLKIIPKKKSLVELGLVDSFGVIEMITYFERKYKIKIEDSEITKEKFGSIVKMVNLVNEKISKI